MTRVVYVAVAIATFVTTASMQDYGPLAYTRRGSHWEGLRGTPISGSIQLLSARVVDGNPPPAQSGTTPRWKDMAFGRFWLPCNEPVAFSVRQIRSQGGLYVLDRVESRWTAGTVNEYAWSTMPVLAKLTRVSSSDLGIVVNLGEGKNSVGETVLPAVLSDELAQDARPSYRFTFRTSAVAEVTVWISSPTERVLVRPKRTEEARNAFTVAWPAPVVDRQWYRLVLEARFEDGSLQRKDVVFLHMAALWKRSRGTGDRSGEVPSNCGDRPAAFP